MEITKADVAVLKELHKELPGWLVSRINTAISSSINTTAVKNKVVDVVVHLDKGDVERYGVAVILAMIKAGYFYVPDKSSSSVLVFGF